MMMKGASKPLMIAAAGVAALSGVGIYAWKGSSRPAVLEIYVFDTPGSPSILIRTPNDRRALIGGGSNADIVRRITKILPFYSRRIDTVVAPIAGGKSVTGLIGVLDRYKVDEAVVPSATLESLGLSSTTDQAYAIFLDKVEKDKISLKKASTGDRFDLDNGVSARVLFPLLSSTEGFKYSRSSGPEIVLRLEYASTSVLFAGTASTKAQKFIATEPRMSSNALVYWHSVVPSNVSGALIDAVAPDIVVYAEQVKKQAGNTAAYPGKKPVTDPLSSIPSGQKLNVKSTGTIRLSSDGMTVKAESLSI